MKLSDASKKELMSELKFIILKMGKETDPLDKLFYYSGFFGVLSRLLNREYSDELVLAHVIAQSSHQELRTRLQNIKQGDTVVPLFEAHFNNLIACLADLLNSIKKDSDISHILQRIAVIGYSATGNGYYLFQKGLLKLQ